MQVDRSIVEALPEENHCNPTWRTGKKKNLKR